MLNLNHELIRSGFDGLDLAFNDNNHSMARKSGLALDNSLGLIKAGMGFDFLVFLHSLEKVQSALALLDVLDTDMDSFLHDSVSDSLVDLDSNGSWGNVPNNSGLSVVVLVWHTLMNGRVGTDIDIVSNVVVDQIGTKLDRSTLSEWLGKKTSGIAPVTFGARHLFT